MCKPLCLPPKQPRIESHMIAVSIDNLSSETNEKEVKRLFSRYGKIRSIKLILGASHSRCGGTGVIELEGSDAKKIITELDGRLLWGRFLRITEVHGAKKKHRSVDLKTPSQSSTASTEGYKSQPFRVVSIEKMTDPELGLEEDWYRYTLIRGNSKITGMHRGTKDEVTEYVVNSAQEFNIRNTSKTGRSYTWSSSRSRK